MKGRLRSSKFVTTSRSVCKALVPVLGLLALAMNAYAANRAFTWTGTSGTSWTAPGNWAGGGGGDNYPNQDASGTDTVTIDGGAGNYPILAGNLAVTLASLTLNSGGIPTASLDLNLGAGNTSTMDVTGNLIDNGALTMGTYAVAGAPTEPTLLTVGGNLSVGGTLDCSGVTGYATSNTADFISIGGSATIGSGGTITTGDHSIAIGTAAGGLTVNGTLDFSAAGAGPNGTGTNGVSTHIDVTGTIGGSAAGGDIDAGGSGSIRAHGNVDFTDITTYTPGSTRLWFLGTSTLTSAGRTIACIRLGSSGMAIPGSLTLADSLTLSGNDASATGALTVGYGVAGNYSSLNVSGRIITIQNGSVPNVVLSTAQLPAADFTSIGSTLVFTGTSTLNSPGLAWNNVTVDAGGSVTLAAALAMNGNLLLGDTGTGALTTSAANFAMTVGGNVTIDAGGTLTANNSAIGVTGNWSNSGTFTAGGSTVTLTPSTTSQLLGSTTFSNFSCTTAGTTLQFAAGQTQTITGTFTVTGTSAGMIKLISTSSGNPWDISAAASSVSYAWVQDSSVTGGADINAGNSHNNGGNTVPPSSPAWIFPAGGNNFTWLTTGTTDWNTGSNWSGGYVPNPTDNVTIDSGGNQPIMSSNSTVNNLTEGAGADINLFGFALTISGTASLASTITNGSASAGSLSVAGPTALAGNASVTTNGGSVTLTGAVNGLFSLTIAAGAGAVSLGAAVGGTSPLTGLTVSSSGTASVPAATTSGAQSYTAATSTTLGGT